MLKIFINEQGQAVTFIQWNEDKLLLEWNILVNFFELNTLLERGKDIHVLNWAKKVKSMFSLISYFEFCLCQKKRHLEFCSLERENFQYLR